MSLTHSLAPAVHGPLMLLPPPQPPNATSTTIRRCFIGHPLARFEHGRGRTAKSGREESPAPPRERRAGGYLQNAGVGGGSGGLQAAEQQSSTPPHETGTPKGNPMFGSAQPVNPMDWRNE